MVDLSSASFVAIPMLSRGQIAGVCEVTAYSLAIEGRRDPIETVNIIAALEGVGWVLSRLFAQLPRVSQGPAPADRTRRTSESEYHPFHAHHQ